MTKSKLFYSVTMIFAAILFLSSNAANASFPERSIQLVVPFNPGGLSDISGRIASDYLSKYFNSPCVVQNTAGAAGTVGSRSVLNARPDGHTLLWHHQSMLVSYVTGIADFNWDGFSVVGRALRTYLVLVVKADAPWDTFSELVADARKRPNEILFGTNVGAVSYFATLETARAADASFRIVGGGGDSERIKQILGGHTHVGNPGISAALPYIQAGELKALGIIADERIPGIDIPTLKEQGFDATLSLDLHLFAPSGTPSEVVDALSDALRGMTEDDEVMERFRKIGFMPGYLPQEEAVEFLKRQTDIYIDLGTEAGVSKVKK